MSQNWSVQQIEPGRFEGDHREEPRASSSPSPRLASTDMGSVVTAFLDTFDGSSNSAYRHWLEAVQPTAASHEYASFVTKKVAAQANGVDNWHNSVPSSGPLAVHDAHIAS